jgi:hypothetical protein
MAAAARYVSFQTQLDIQHAGLERIAHVRMPDAPPWRPGETCVSCGNLTRRRRCQPCRDALRAIFARSGVGLVGEVRRLVTRLWPFTRRTRMTDPKTHLVPVRLTGVFYVEAQEQATRRSVDLPTLVTELVECALIDQHRAAIEAGLPPPRPKRPEPGGRPERRGSDGKP